MEPDDGSEDDGPLLPWISPDDRLWRHPSEVGSSSGRPPAPTPRPVRAGGARLWTVAIAAGVVGAVLASGVGIATGSFVHRTTVLSPVTRLLGPAMPVTTAATSSTANAPNWPAIADDVAPSVVTITSSGPSGEQVGSGVLYTSIGDQAYILTSAALVGDGQIKVTFDDSEVQRARIVGLDRETGVGLISVPGGKRNFPAFAPETSLQVAQPVMGIGARGAMSDPDVTTGSINALDVAVDTGDNSTMENLIDISSSAVVDLGAALVNPQGAVFGIEAPVNTPDAGQAGQNFAVPYDIADHVAKQLLAGVHVTHPWLGVINAKDPSSATASELSLSGGSQVTQVSPGSPAERAGLAPSDIITAFDGHPVASTGELTSLVCDSAPGQPATVTYIHQGRSRSATVTLQDTPSDVALTAGTGS